MAVVSIGLSYRIVRSAANAARDYGSIEDTELRYMCFCGDVVFRIGDADLSAMWGWVPVLDFAFCLRSIARSLDTSVNECFEFTESSAQIHFRRQGDLVLVSSNYAEATAAVSRKRLVSATDLFLRRVITDLRAEYPALVRNPAFQKIEALTKAGTD